MLSQSRIITYLCTVLHCIENGAEKNEILYVSHLVLEGRGYYRTTKETNLQVQNMPSPQSSRVQLHKTNGGHYHWYRKCCPGISILSNHFLQFSLSASLRPQVIHFLSDLLPSLLLFQLSFKRRQL